MHAFCGDCVPSVVTKFVEPDSAFMAAMIDAGVDAPPYEPRRFEVISRKLSLVNPLKVPVSIKLI